MPKKRRSRSLSHTGLDNSRQLMNQFPMHIRQFVYQTNKKIQKQTKIDIITKANDKD